MDVVHLFEPGASKCVCRWYHTVYANCSADERSYRDASLVPRWYIQNERSGIREDEEFGSSAIW